MSEVKESKFEPILSLDAGEEELDPEIILISKEGEKCSINKRAIMLSELISTSLSGDSEATEVPLYHIETAIVKRIIEYCKYHQKIPPRNIEKPLISTDMRDLVDKFDANFIDSMEQETIFKLLLAANYMNIKPLLLLTCAKIGTLLKGKTPEQIKQTFNIRQDYTPAEEEEIRKEYKDLIG